MRRPLAALLTLIALASAPGRSEAASHAPTPADEAVVKQATAVVVGSFTDERTVSIREYPDQYDDQGQRYTYREAITTVALRVSAQVHGAPLPSRVLINVVGGAQGAVRTRMAMELPAATQRVMVALEPDSRSPGSYVLVHGKVFDARSEASLDELRQWVRAVHAAPSQPAGEPWSPALIEPPAGAPVQVVDMPPGAPSPQASQGAPTSGPLRGEPVVPAPAQAPAPRAAPAPAGSPDQG